MRLSSNQIIAIRQAIHSTTSHVSAIRLFGSRLNEQIRGGDVDLMLDISQPVEHPAELSARLAVRISRALENRKVDVVLRAPNLEQTAIHKIALAEGVQI